MKKVGILLLILSFPSPLLGAEGSCTQVHYVTATGLRLREGPGANFKKITDLSPNARVCVISSPKEGFVKVILDDPSLQEGWLAQEFLGTEPVAQSNDVQRRSPRSSSGR